MAADHGHRKCGIAAAVHKSLALHIAVQIDFLIGNSVVGKKFLDLAAVRTCLLYTSCKCQVLCLDRTHNIHWKNVIMNPYGYIYKGGTYG